MDSAEGELALSPETRDTIREAEEAINKGLRSGILEETDGQYTQRGCDLTDAQIQEIISGAVTLIQSTGVFTFVSGVEVDWQDPRVAMSGDDSVEPSRRERQAA
jgi:hypothetical protein